MSQHVGNPIFPQKWQVQHTIFWKPVKNENIVEHIVRMTIFDDRSFRERFLACPNMPEIRHPRKNGKRSTPPPENPSKAKTPPNTPSGWPFSTTLLLVNIFLTTYNSCNCLNNSWNQYTFQVRELPDQSAKVTNWELPSESSKAKLTNESFKTKYSKRWMTELLAKIQQAKVTSQGSRVIRKVIMQEVPRNVPNGRSKTAIPQIHS